MFERAFVGLTHDEQFDACLLLDRHAAVALKLVPPRHTENLDQYDTIRIAISPKDL